MIFAIERDMPMRQSLGNMRRLGLGLALAIGLTALASCSPSKLLGGASPTPLSGDETATAIATELPDQDCVPAVAATPQPVPLGTSVTLIGACWKPGETISFAFINPASNNLDPADLTVTVRADGRFSASLTLTSTQSADVRDAHLPMIAYGPSFTQTAAVSIEVSG
jgi:hypothetical protein